MKSNPELKPRRPSRPGLSPGAAGLMVTSRVADACDLAFNWEQDWEQNWEQAWNWVDVGRGLKNEKPSVLTEGFALGDLDGT